MGLPGPRVTVCLLSCDCVRWCVFECRSAKAELDYYSFVLMSQRFPSLFFPAFIAHTNCQAVLGTQLCCRA